MTYATILFSREGGVARLTLNRPDRLNSFTVKMHAEVMDALGRVRADGARTLVLSGAGRGFCAGQDLSDDAVAPGSDLGHALEARYNPLIRALTELPVPVICAVNGVAAGAGANIALACDIVLAARSAKFIQSFANIGLVPDSGGTWTLPRLVGQARAVGLAMNGKPVAAEQAEAWGMIWACVDDDKLVAETDALASRLAAAPTKGLAATKHLIRAAWSADLGQALDAERDAQSALGRTADYAEGVDAFTNKRPRGSWGAEGRPMTLKLNSFAEDRWAAPAGATVEIAAAVTGDIVAICGSSGLDLAAMAAHARRVGGPALRALGFHDRAKLLKSLAEAIMARKEELYDLSLSTGATRADGWIDIEGGAGTLFTYASKGRRELPNTTLLIDGDAEILGKTGAFIGQHVWTSLQGVAVHINAYNFPVWGMLEKLGPTLLAGVPAIIKPATATAYVAERAFRILIEANVLPPGALQFVAGGVGDLFNHLTGQDVVSFTGSAETAAKLTGHPVVLREGVRFIAEQDSLNASILGPDAGPDTPEFDLFIKEVVREMTVKAGQKCTAIRRALVPSAWLDQAETALTDRLSKIVIGDPRDETVRMGALVSQAQLQDVRSKVAALGKAARIVFGDVEVVKTAGGQGGAFISPILLRAEDPWTAPEIHEIEAFGPVATLMPYRDLDDAVALAALGKGSLVASLFTRDPAAARQVVMGAAAFHGRLVVIDRESAQESTGHGSPMPGLVHGGPGRAGGGEEMGGVRGLTHYMQRTALQGSPKTLSFIVGQQLPGAPQTTGEAHPFRKRYGELDLGYTLRTGSRTITLEDIEHFAHFTGDTFYAHMDEEAAKASPIFGGRVAHGYLILSFAAGLFVDPAPGPVLANYGLESLRFVKPMKPGDSMSVALTAKSKALRNPQMGEVRWGVVVTNQNGEVAATYDLLTMNAV